MSKVKLTGQSGEELWDFADKRLEEHLSGTDFISSESILIAVTPYPKYGQAALNNAVALALAQGMGIQQQRMSTQLYEIGSSRKYTFNSGRVQGSVSLSSALFAGNNLLKNLTPASSEDGGENELTVTASDAKPGNVAGYGNFYSNLNATLFNRPVGIFILIRDVGNKNVGCVFLQECYIQAHGFNFDSNSPVLVENAQILFEGVYPVQHKSSATPPATVVTSNGNSN